MNKQFFKKAGKILGVLLILFILILSIVPFLIPVKPLEDLSSNQQVALNESNFITVPFEGTDGIDIHYLEDGTTSEEQPYTFVLLHGSNFNSFTWNKVIDIFGKYGRVIAYDQIPYGLSEKLVEGDWTGQNPYTSAAAVNQLFSFLDALEIDNVILVGNSYGGTLAVQATQANSGRVDGLILVDAAVYVQEEMPAWVMNLPQMKHIGPLFARKLGQSKAFFNMTYFDPEQISEDRMSLTTIQTQVTNWDYAYWEYLRAWGTETPDIISMISTLKQPVLVISGEFDNVVPQSDSEKLNSELPNSEIVILSDCGHVPQEECPLAFGNTISTWLSQMNGADKP